VIVIALAVVTCGLFAVVLSTGPGANTARADGTAAARAAAPDADFFDSAVTGIRPAVEGVAVEVADHGGSVTVRSESAHTIIVLGYGNEPFLRLSPTGVDENTASVTSAVAAGEVRPLPTSAVGDPAKVPARWVHRGDRPIFTWSDYRVRWSAPQRPSVVVDDPDRPRDVLVWGLPITVDGDRAVVTGVLRWTGESSRLQRLLTIIGGTLVVLLAGGGSWVLAGKRRRGASGPVTA
jgi:hypothetical protein